MSPTLDSSFPNFDPDPDPNHDRKAQILSQYGIDPNPPGGIGPQSSAIKVPGQNSYVGSPGPGITVGARR